MQAPACRTRPRARPGSRRRWPISAASRAPGRGPRAGRPGRRRPTTGTCRGRCAAPDRRRRRQAPPRTAAGRRRSRFIQLIDARRYCIQARSSPAGDDAIVSRRTRCAPTASPPSKRYSADARRRRRTAPESAGGVSSQASLARSAAASGAPRARAWAAAPSRHRPHADPVRPRRARGGGPAPPGPWSTLGQAACGAVVAPPPARSGRASSPSSGWLKRTRPRRARRSRPPPRGPAPPSPAHRNRRLRRPGPRSAGSRRRSRAAGPGGRRHRRREARGQQLLEVLRNRPHVAARAAAAIGDDGPGSSRARRAGSRRSPGGAATQPDGRRPRPSVRAGSGRAARRQAARTWRCWVTGSARSSLEQVAGCVRREAERGERPDRLVGETPQRERQDARPTADRATGRRRRRSPAGIRRRGSGARGRSPARPRAGPVRRPGRPDRISAPSSATRNGSGMRAQRRVRNRLRGDRRGRRTRAAPPTLAARVVRTR